LLTPDVGALSKAFSFVAVPFGVALENGRQRAVFTSFELQPTTAALRKMGFVK